MTTDRLSIAHIVSATADASVCLPRSDGDDGVRLIFPFGAVCVVQLLQQEPGADGDRGVKQMFYRAHSGNVGILAVDQTQGVVASAEVDSGVVHVWSYRHDTTHESDDATSLPTLSILQYNKVDAEKTTTIQTTHICFSEDGKLLALLESCQTGDVIKKRIRLWNWPKARLLASTNVQTEHDDIHIDLNHVRAINCLNSSHLPSEMVIVCGDDGFLRIWRRMGSTFESHSGDLNRKKFPDVSLLSINHSMVSFCDESTNQAVVICGGSNGKLFLWRNATLYGEVTAHKAPVVSIYHDKRKDRFVTTDGDVVTMWEDNFDSSTKLNAALDGEKDDHCIVERLIGTIESELFIAMLHNGSLLQFYRGKNTTPSLLWNAIGEPTACCALLSEHTVLIAVKDLHLWRLDAVGFSMKQIVSIKKKCVAMQSTADGKTVVLAYNDGALSFHDRSLQEVSSLSALKGDGATSSSIVNMDFSADSTKLTIYYKDGSVAETLPGSRGKWNRLRAAKPTATKPGGGRFDARFDPSWLDLSRRLNVVVTAAIEYHDRKVKQKDEGSKDSWVAAGLHDGTIVRLLRTKLETAKGRLMDRKKTASKVHPSAIKQLFWLHERNLLVSRCDSGVVLWRTEARQSEDGESTDEDSRSETTSVSGSEEVDSDLERETSNAANLSLTRLRPDKHRRIREARKLIREEMKAKGRKRTDAPIESLRMDRVFGYRGYDSHNNLCFTESGLLVYHCAAVGIVIDRSVTPTRQQLYIGHTDDILCLAPNPVADIIATGEIGAKPAIHIWTFNQKDGGGGAKKDDLLKTLSILKGRHTNGVCSLDFSEDGRRLASLGLDQHHSLILWDWKKGECLATTRSHSDRVFTVRFRPPDDNADDRLVTVGVKHVKFWTRKGGGFVSSRGVFGKTAKMDTMLCAEYGDVESGPACFTGSSKGKIYVWGADNKLQRVEDAHKGPCFAIYRLDKGFVTGGKDGRVLIWNGNFTKRLQSYSLDKCRFPRESNGRGLVNPCPVVRAVAMGHGVLVAGTKYGEIVEIDIKGKARILVQGHGEGEVWGLAAHPSCYRCATASDDGCVRVWDFQPNSDASGVVIFRTFPDQCPRRIAYSSDGNVLAVGCKNGSIIILQSESLDTTTTLHHRSEEISDLKFYMSDSSQSRLGYLAVASHDNFVDVYDSDSWKRVAVCKGASSYVSHLDWSADGSLIRISTGANERLVFEIPSGKRLPLEAETADSSIDWITRDDVLASSLNGIWPPNSDITDVNQVDVRLMGVVDEEENLLVASADDYGLVKLFRYPCSGKFAKMKSYLGHSAHVTNVKWSYDGQYLVSIGGADTALVVWKLLAVKALEGKKNGELVVAKGGKSDSSDTDSEEDGYDSDVEREKALDYNSKMFAKPLRERISDAEGEASNRHARVNGRTTKRMKNDTVSLYHVFGYRGFDCANNTMYIDDAGKEIVFHTAGIGIVQHVVTGDQRFYREHSDDILCLAVNEASYGSDRHDGGGPIVATAQIDVVRPSVRIWETRFMKTLSVIKTKNDKGVNCISFNKSGRRLLTAGIDHDHTVTVWRWQSGRAVATAFGSPAKIFDAKFNHNSENEFVTVGVKHLKFWKVCGGQLVDKKAVYVGLNSMPTMLCVEFDNHNTAYTGSVTGDVYLWQDASLQTKIEKAHGGPIFTMHFDTTTELLTTGAKEKMSKDASCVKVWKDNECVHEFSAANLFKDRSIVAVKSVCTINNRCVVGTKSCDILEWTFDASSMPRFLLQSHEDGALWGLATSLQSNSLVATASYDKSIRFWDIEKKAMVMRCGTTEHATCIDFLPHNGSVFAVGFANGTVSVYNFEPANKQPSDYRANPLSSRRDRSSPVNVVRFNPQGGVLAVGYEAAVIDLYAVRLENGKTAVLERQTYIKSPSTSVLHADFSTDGAFLKVCTLSGDTLLIDTVKGVTLRRPNQLSKAQSVVWATTSCVTKENLADYANEEWSASALAMIVNSIAKSPNGKLLAAGDDYGFVRVMHRKSRGAITKQECYCGHSANVTNVAFTNDGCFLLSNGGDDTSLFVWKVKQ